MTQNMYFWIFTFFITARYMVKLACFSISPHTTYWYILIWLSDKLTSKRASWNYAKLAPLGKCFPKSYVNPCRFLIHFVFSSIWVKWAYKRWRVGIILNCKKNLDVNLQKKLEPVFVKHYGPNIFLHLNMAKVKRYAMLRNWYNQFTHPALKTKREITEYKIWQQFTKSMRGKPTEQLFPRHVVIQLPKIY